MAISAAQPTVAAPPSADERRLVGLTLIQHHTNDGWMVWHEGPGDRTAELFSMTAHELGTMDAMVRAHVGRVPAQGDQ